MAATPDDGKKKRIAIIGICSFLLVAMVVAVTVGVSLNNKDDTDKGNKNQQVSGSMKAIKEMCAPTEFKKTCEENLQKEAKGTTDPTELVQAAFKATKRFVDQALKNSTALQDLEKDNMTKQALSVCKLMLNTSLNDLERSFKTVGNFDITSAKKMLEDLNIWLSASMTNQYTCLREFEKTNSSTNAGEKMKKALKVSIELSKNGLTIVNELANLVGSFDLSRRRLLSKAPVVGHGKTVLPTWTEKPEFRRLIDTPPAELKPDIVVAKDGSGKYKTIGESLKDIPKAARPGNQSFVIYVKEGIYEENLIFDFPMINVALIGDGADKTRITAAKCYGAGVSTFYTATVAVYAPNFFAKNIGFENSAGAMKYQAVALLSMSDMSVFYNCSMDGYQDTLYAHTRRQFYRDCNVTGTIDFIFGNAAAIFQNCRFMFRKPMDGQQNIMAASNRQADNENTGFILHNCTVTAAPEYIPVRAKYPSYLGRPWGHFAKTIVMESVIDDFVIPEGWAKWEQQEVGLQTSFFAEFKNTGNGSNPAHRATWPCVRKITEKEAREHTPLAFFKETNWIELNHVPFIPGLLADKPLDGAAAAKPIMPSSDPIV